MDRYILRFHIGPFIFGSTVVLFLFLLQFIIRHIDQLVGKGLSLWVIVQLISLNLAWMVVLAVPIGVLFSTLMAFGSLSASHEVTSIKAGGGSLIRMMIPVVIIGILMTVALFWFNDYVLPEANHQAKVLMSDIKRKKPTFELESGKFSTGLEGYTILARKVDSLTGLLRGVTIYDNRKSNITNIVSADTGYAKFNDDYSKLILTLFNGEIHQLVPSSVKNYKIIDFKKHIISIDARGFSLVRTNENLMSRGDREMRISDMTGIRNESLAKAEYSAKTVRDGLKDHFDYMFGIEEIDSAYKDISPVKFRIKQDQVKTKKEIYRDVYKRLTFLKSTIQSDVYREAELKRKARQYEVEIQKKYAIPFACLVFVLVGCPLGIKTRGGNFGISAAITLGFYIFYWACLIGGEKLADRGFITPFMSMWLGNFIIGLMGIVLTITVSNESFRIPIAGIFRKKKR